MYTCPICGYGELEMPAYTDYGASNNELCLSCGFEFGFHDDSEGITVEQWREEWIAEGMPWRCDEEDKPEHWNPKAQLFRIGVKVE